MLMLAAILVAAVVTKVYLALLSLILLFNIMLVFCVGRQAIQVMVFPYSMDYLKIQMDKRQSDIYAQEFVAYMEKVYVMMQF